VRGEQLKESDLYDPVKQWLENRDYEVFCEVEPRYTGSRADVVGINPTSIAVVELKLSLSLDLLEQAVQWSQRKYVNYIYIAVPWKTSKKSRWDRSPKIDNWVVSYICRTFNIGVLFVEETRDGLKVNDKPFLPSRYQRIGKENGFRNVIEKYNYEYKNSELKGGQSGGGYISDYRVTVDRVKEFLRNVRTGNRFSLYWHDDNGKTIDIKEKAIDGWVDMKTILDYCETHYASPKASLSKALRDFENSWCESSLINRKLHFRYKE
jgi:hypothetical protein